MSASLLDEARRRLEAGDPRSARQLAERVLEASRASGMPNVTPAAARVVGECLYVMGEIGAARAFAEESLRVDEETGDPGALAADLNLLGVVEITEGRLDQAIPLLRRSYDLRTAALGSDHGDTIESLNNLAVALWRRGDEDAALRLHEDALGRCERALGEEHRRTAETLNALAVKLESRADSQTRARELYERALVSAEAALGPDSELVARLLANVATARLNMGEADTAGLLLERSLELHERHFGPMSRWTAYVLVAQGEHAWSEGRFQDARRAYERVFVINVKEVGPAEPETLDSAVGLMNVLTELTGEPEAPDAIDEATALYLPLLALHPDIQGTFPGGASPDPARAVEQLIHIAERLERRVEPDEAQVAAIARAGDLVDEADVSYLEGDLSAARIRLQEAIALIEVARGPRDASLVEPLQRLRLVHRVGGTESAVLPLLRRIASILAGAYGELHPLAIRALGEVYWQERREYGPAGGGETASRISTLMRDALGEESSVSRVVLDVIAAARESVPPGMEPEDPPLSIRRERILAEHDPLRAELLFDLDATPWPSLDHAYGPAIDTPMHLRLLLTDDDRVRDDALELLGESLLHQGSVCAATAPAVRLIRRLANDERVPGRDRLTSFLVETTAIARAASGPYAAELIAALGEP